MNILKKIKNIIRFNKSRITIENIDEEKTSKPIQQPQIDEGTIKKIKHLRELHEANDTVILQSGHRIVHGGKFDPVVNELENRPIWTSDDNKTMKDYFESRPSSSFQVDFYLKRPVNLLDLSNYDIFEIMRDVSSDYNEYDTLLREAFEAAIFDGVLTKQRSILIFSPKDILRISQEKESYADITKDLVEQYKTVPDSKKLYLIDYGKKVYLRNSEERFYKHSNNATSLGLLMNSSSDEYVTLRSIHKWRMLNIEEVEHSDLFTKKNINDKNLKYRIMIAAAASLGFEGIKLNKHNIIVDCIREKFELDIEENDTI